MAFCIMASEIGKMKDEINNVIKGAFLRADLYPLE